MAQPEYKLYYWPLPFKGSFVSYQFAYKGVPLLEETQFEEIQKLKSLSPFEQKIPFMGPPILENIETGRILSQMPAILLYVSDVLNLKGKNPQDIAMDIKIIMDCNDLLMEICRYNGAIMWERPEWIRFRSKRLPRWMTIFEESLKRKFFGNDMVSFVDIAVYALFGNMTRCLPDLDGDLLQNAPGVHSLCQKIGSTPSLSEFVEKQDSQYGDLYCGGQIEKSIRKMLYEDKA